MSNFLESQLGDWHPLLKPVLDTDEFKLIPKVLKSSFNKQFTPKRDEIFKAYQLTQFKDLKVVILGEMPYTKKPGLATGLAYGIPKDELLNPSYLNTLWMQIERDTTGLKLELDVTLESWAKQGILLLNTSLTSQVGNDKNVHSKMWEPLIVRTLEVINNYSTGVIFLLWGDHAKSYKRYIWESSNNILEADHVTGSGHFKEVNKLLKGMNNNEIVW